MHDYSAFCKFMCGEARGRPGTRSHPNATPLAKRRQRFISLGAHRWGRTPRFGWRPPVEWLPIEHAPSVAHRMAGVHLPLPFRAEHAQRGRLRIPEGVPSGRTVGTIQ